MANYLEMVDKMRGFLFSVEKTEKGDNKIYTVILNNPTKNICDFIKERADAKPKNWRLIIKAGGINFTYTVRLSTCTSLSGILDSFIKNHPEVPKKEEGMYLYGPHAGTSNATFNAETQVITLSEDATVDSIYKEYKEYMASKSHTEDALSYAVPYFNLKQPKEKIEMKIRDQIVVGPYTFDHPNKDTAKAKQAIMDFAESMLRLKGERKEMKKAVGFLPDIFDQKFNREISDLREAIEIINDITLLEDEDDN